MNYKEYLALYAERMRLLELGELHCEDCGDTIKNAQDYMEGRDFCVLCSECWDWNYMNPDLEEDF